MAGEPAAFHVGSRGGDADVRGKWLWPAIAMACAAGDATSGAGLSAGSPGPGPEESSGDVSAAATDGSVGSTTGSGSTGDATLQTGSDGGADTSCVPTLWYRDDDGDGRGDPMATVSACDPPPGYVPFGDDCDDADPLRNVAATELCNGADDDCDGAVDEVSASNTSCNGCSLFEADGRAYAYCPAGATFDGARQACAAFAGDLVVLGDVIEASAVAGGPAPTPAVGGGWFIGLSDRATEGTFVWIDDTVPEFTAWNPGEPNDASGNEDCGEMAVPGGTWNDVPCDASRAFICETPTP